MYQRMTKESQPVATFEAARRLVQKQKVLTHESPRPGDVFLSRRTADFPVEWLVIETDDGRARVVPVDEHPLVGSRDLVLDADALAGVAVSRCDLDAWVERSELEVELRTGAVTPSDLEEVRRKRRANEDGELLPTTIEEEVDGDPEYLRWRDGTVRRAIDVLLGTEKDPVPQPLLLASVRPPRAWGWPMAVAASVLLVLALGGLLYRTSLRLGVQEKRVAELEGERHALEERLAETEADRESASERVGLLESTVEALEAQTSRLEERLVGALQKAVVVNVPSFVLGKTARTRAGRGEPEVIAHGGAARMTLSLEVVDPSPYFRYRLEVVERSSGEEVWRTEDLRKVNGKWLRMDVPTALFEETEYELRIHGLGREGARRLDEKYVVKIER